ncbi:transglutaminase domain-containing protein [Paenibacillus glycinis]|uniref:Transglutaminase domain-containing protein n=1 Tax=Paenibacillus glycinis TaxID=2697035 RepID=A0ABW9XV42_9BACL|nr:transglutaminase domain-containing protein [Paenibacillus glycinis]NBD26533.1 transglutaminase domain-containing protein [Paenibacillus glycinis]
MTTKQPCAFDLDHEEMASIERKLQEKRAVARPRERELFGVFEEALTEEEAWALKYLYAYMPVNDLADYDGRLFLSHVRKTLEIRERMPWGTRVPDRLFLAFVLPYRVNTENIEDSRGVLHAELAERTLPLTMADAILETNYWCHEKAVYVGSDLRTLSPLSMIRNARGRCGEESTLAVAALRSIGIPARQVYTPLWAHCDSNHAWVEAWADGTWHYFGACEPEARLNQGWFSPPARRAMLVNTRIAGDYRGPEDITLAHERFTEINLLANYAPARTLTVAVKDEQGMPASGAQVRFELYNMAEFQPIATLPTNERGEAVLITGYGDLLIRAAKDGRWGEAAAVADADRIEIVLASAGLTVGTVDLDMTPPPEREGEAGESLPEETISRHNRRLEEGARIRAAYEATFLNEVQAAELAGTTGLPADRVWDVLRKARGNSREIAAFLREHAAVHGQWALLLLESLNEKDLTDTFRPALEDHLLGALDRRGELPEDVFVPYVLCPRVLHEMIVPYRRLFRSAFTEAEVTAFRAEPSALARKLGEGYAREEDLPNLKGKGNPAGTFNLMKGDRMSLAILFVAVCRSLGIPARLEPSEQKPQFRAGGSWQYAVMDEDAALEQAAAHPGTLRLLRDAEAPAEAPAAAYAENFTFARLENGVYKTLLYPHGKTDVYDKPFEAEPGSYRLTTGVRLKDGTVRVRFAYFAVRAGEETSVALTYREAEAELPVLGTLDASAAVALPDGTGKRLEALLGQDGAIAAWIEPEREPTKHLLRELGELADRFAELGTPIVLLVGDAEWTASFDPSHYPKLPAAVVFVRDSTSAAMPDAISRPPASEAGFPHLFVVDGERRIRYAASGYKIGTGKEALRALSGLSSVTMEGGAQA